MKRFLVGGLAALLAPACALAAPGDALNPMQMRPGIVTPVGYCQLSVITVAQTSTCTGGIPNGANYAVVCNEGTAARWRDDGVAPTTTMGNILGTGTATAPVCAGFTTTFATLQWIAESGTAVLDFTFYR